MKKARNIFIALVVATVLTFIVSVVYVVHIIFTKDVIETTTKVEPCFILENKEMKVDTIYVYTFKK